SVARPAITTLALSADDRSHDVSPSYMVLPVKRLPSNPWSGCPSVRGMSAAVMPIRTTDWASADEAAANASEATAAMRTSLCMTASILWPLPVQRACQSHDSARGVWPAFRPGPVEVPPPLCPEFGRCAQVLGENAANRPV